MKQPKGKIHQLIQAMSPAEKRYFKRHYASPQGNLTQLFDFLNNMQEYDEELIKKEFTDSKLSKNLKVYKVQLLNLLLKSLVSYHSKNSPKSQIRIGLEEVDVLMSKQLYKHAHDRLKRIKKDCLKYEEYSYLIEISYKEFRLQYIQSDRIGLSKNPVFSELKQNIERLEEQVKLTLLSSQVMDHRKSITKLDPTESYEEYCEQIMNSTPLMNINPEQLTFRSNLSRNIIFSNIYYFLKDKEKQQALKKYNVDLFEEFPHFKSYLTFEYLAVLLNYTNLCLEEKEFGKVEIMVEQAKLFAGNNPEFKRQLVYFYYALVRAKFEQQQFKENTSKIEEEIIQLITEYKIDKERIALIIYCHFALSYLALKKPKKVQAYILLMQHCHPDPRSYFAELIHILELIHHYETKDENIVANGVNSLQRKYKEQKNSFFGALLRLFNKLIRYPGQQGELARIFLEEKEQYKEDRIYFLFHYLELDTWLIALSNKKSYASEVNKKSLT